jgi:hypothetical protein
MCFDSAQFTQSSERFLLRRFQLRSSLLNILIQSVYNDFKSTWVNKNKADWTSVAIISFSIADSTSLGSYLNWRTWFQWVIEYV